MENSTGKKRQKFNFSTLVQSLMMRRNERLSRLNLVDRGRERNGKFLAHSTGEIQIAVDGRSSPSMYTVNREFGNENSI